MKDNFGKILFCALIVSLAIVYTIYHFIDFTNLYTHITKSEPNAMMPDNYIKPKDKTISEMEVGEINWIQRPYIHVDENGNIWVANYTPLQNTDSFLHIKGYYPKITKTENGFVLEVNTSYDYKWEKEDINLFKHLYTKAIEIKFVKE